MKSMNSNNRKSSGNNADRECVLQEFQQHQYAFTASIRNPEQHTTPPGIEERRMNIYRELVYNNIEDLLANFFPVLKQVTPEARWHSMVRDFVAHHKSRTPIFMKVGEEFVIYLQTEFSPQPDDPEYLIELAHYEWVEIALDVASEAPEWEIIDRHGDLASGIPYLSPLTWPLYYHYPVHRIGPDYLPAERSAIHLLVYRDNADEVQFMQMNPVTAHLLNAIKLNTESETKRNGMQLLQQIAADLQHPNPDVVVTGGLQTLDEWFKRDVLLGTYK